MTNKSGWLFEISFMRLVLLVMLVSYHAFAPFCGAWEMPKGLEHNEVYKWFANFFYAFLLEGYIFISGYIFTMQMVGKNKYKSLSSLALNKFKRLIIPCWVFGIAYWLLLARDNSLLVVLNGIGHLWFLPCLFWCSIIIYTFDKLAEKFGLSESLFLLLSLICMVLSVISIPFQICRALYYCFFFYLGGLFWKYNNRFTFKVNTMIVTVLIVAFIAVLIFVNLFNGSHVNASIIIKVVKIMLKAILATTGITMLYFIALMYTRKFTLNSTFMNIGTMAYGVYIFHQFILKYIYYHTPFPNMGGTLIFPWISLIITIVFSLLLTYIFRKTKIGRFLI